MESTSRQQHSAPDSNLIVYDVPDATLNSITAALFALDCMGFGTWADRVGSSPVKQWYRDATRSNESPLRPLAWRENKDFRPENIHVRTLDTGRLIPTNTKFGIHVYASRRHWIEVDRKGTRDAHIIDLMSRMVSRHEPPIMPVRRTNSWYTLDSRTRIDTQHV